MNRFSRRRSWFARLSGFSLLPPLAAAVSLAIAAPLQAEDAPQTQGTAPAQNVTQSQGTPPRTTPEQSRQIQETNGVQAEYTALRERIDQIHRETLQAHPELQKREQALQAQITQKMNDSGYNLQKELPEINKLEAELRDDKTPVSEREALLGEYQSKVAALRNAQAQALQNPDVHAARQQLQGDVLSAMKVKDPQIETLLLKQQQLNQKLLRELAQRVQQSQQEKQEAWQKLQQSKQELEQAEQRRQQALQKLQQGD